MLIVIQAYLYCVLSITALFGLFKFAYCYGEKSEFVPRRLCDRTTVFLLKNALQANIFSIFLKVLIFAPKLIIINAYLFFAIIFVR